MKAREKHIEGATTAKITIVFIFILTLLLTYYCYKEWRVSVEELEDSEYISSGEIEESHSESTAEDWDKAGGFDNYRLKLWCKNFLSKLDSEGVTYTLISKTLHDNGIEVTIYYKITSKGWFYDGEELNGFLFILKPSEMKFSLWVVVNTPSTDIDGTQRPYDIQWASRTIFFERLANKERTGELKEEASTLLNQF